MKSEMSRKKSYPDSQTGKLYLVPTPIGNLEDMTFRSVKTLQEVDLIAAEDTRNTMKLLNHFEIRTPQTSLHEHNFKERIPQLLEELLAGKNIAQVSDAGMPSISDPGHELVVAAIEKDIPVIALPGATAGMTALIASGLNPQPFTFYGFLPRKKSQQKEVLETLKGKEETIIFYESPFRLKETLENMAEVFSNRQGVICRELTKIHEEYLRGPILSLAEELKENPVKGECILMVEGATEALPQEELPQTIEGHFSVLENTGMTSKEIIKEVAKVRKLKKQDVYKIYHQLND